MGCSEPRIADFTASLNAADPIASLRAGAIGDGIAIPGPFGTRPLLYADHVASGRALRQVEAFVAEQVLPFYANSHTEASFCGRAMTRLRREARQFIADECGADARFATIFAGAGATAGLNRLVSLLDIADSAASGTAPLVLIGPYEHHSNILPWRESGAEIVEIPEAEAGGPDLAVLAQVLRERAAGRLTVGSFSAASNVTGILTDADAVTDLLKRHGALAVWDYACGAPYLSTDMRAGTPFEKDAVVLSGHKFLGGPGASGILIVRRDAVRRATPSHAGGGTVRFVSPWGHDFTEDLAAREEAGTPNVVGDIRTALCFAVKAAIGQDWLDRRHETLLSRALSRWSDHPDIVLLGNPNAARRLPIFAFRIRDRRNGGFLHPQLATRLLSDLHGIQARGGCACAGPYAHRLLEINAQRSAALRAAILSGDELRKPGWTRLNLSALLTEDKLERILAAVETLARDAEPWLSRYRADPATARFRFEDEPARTDTLVPA
ncbi:aminotransferase class V-fold PLP-dependent enzyme [Acetobacteraceae bacterium KSS8]|uniref:Aminotransferase class V-fold PLP-dependent enzyme n=1 Tax=Endosaccharibacter trunci TaxID=2812733 RepID=A0ABT1W9Y5_9PROT|nr:aminotransferase class V-fold PLP-dependent enzyme [Acetobacteraceae bacterium KSS8]